jgi:predicted carbohydrate-binding protein with CBM5 and CBM33 domain
MTAVRRTGALVAASGIAALVGVLPAQPALAHGATTQPVSRTAACAAGGRDADSAACRAALAANGRPFGSFDNLRVPGVDGRDKQFIRDGKLCSGDLPEFAGLDLARGDWPATRFTAGDKINIRYAGVIPHKGTFRVYLTKQGYDPKRPLGWDDLGAKPFLEVTDPPLRDGAYRMSGKLPADRSGRHVMYVVWQTSSTPDTYYSCSDLILKTAGAAAAPPRTTGTTQRAKPLSSRSPAPGAVATPPEAGDPVSGPGAPAARESWLSKTVDDSRNAPGRQFASAALIVLAGVAAGMAVIRIRRARNLQTLRRRPGNR